MTVEDKNGFKVKIKRNSAPSELKKPLFCPVEGCRRITSNLDDPFLLEFACCQMCWIMHIENRQTPTIDVELLKKQVKERGY